MAESKKHNKENSIIIMCSDKIKLCCINMKGTIYLPFFFYFETCNYGRWLVKVESCTLVIGTNEFLGSVRCLRCTQVRASK